MAEVYRNGCKGVIALRYESEEDRASFVKALKGQFGCNGFAVKDGPVNAYHFGSIACVIWEPKDHKSSKAYPRGALFIDEAGHLAEQDAVELLLAESDALKEKGCRLSADIYFLS